MGSEKIPINPIACVICNNVEGDMISVPLKGFQMEVFSICLRNERGIICQTEYSSIRVEDVIMPNLYKQKQKQ